MEHRTDFRNAPTAFLHLHKSFSRVQEAVPAEAYNIFTILAVIWQFFPFFLAKLGRAFRHGALLSKEPPLVDAWNCSIFGRSAFSVKNV